MSKRIKKTAQQLKKGESIDIHDLKFNPVEIDRSREVEIDDICMFCKKDLCECDNTAAYGYVKKELYDYKKVGDFALAKRDSFSKWEKEAKDQEYADSSRLAAHKLDMEKRGAKQYDMKDEVRREVLSNPDKRLKYIMTGET